MNKRKETKTIIDTLSRPWKKYLKRLSSKRVRQKESGDLSKHRLHSSKYDDQCF